MTLVWLGAFLAPGQVTTTPVVHLERAGRAVDIAREDAPSTPPVFRVTVASLPEHLTVATWRCRSVSVSPDGRFIAYTEFHPVQDPNPASVYLLYDIDAPPASRPPSRGAPATDEPGWAFFPDQSRSGIPHDTSDYNEMDVHQLFSPLVWADDHRLVFLDNADLKTRVVLVDFSKGVTMPRIAIRPLDELSIANPARQIVGADRAGLLRARTLTATATPGGVDVIVAFQPGWTVQPEAFVHFED